MINKQKLWFLTLFSLILVLSVYYITMPSELLTTSGKTNKEEKEVKEEAKVNVSETDPLTILQVEADEERAALAAEYNSVLTSKDATTEEKNNAYEGLKQIDDVKAKEEELKKKLKTNLKLSTFVKINGNTISVTVKKEEHDYSLANNIMKTVQEEFKDKMYISVKFQK